MESIAKIVIRGGKGYNEKGSGKKVLNNTAQEKSTWIVIYQDKQLSPFSLQHCVTNEIRPFMML